MKKMFLTLCLALFSIVLQAAKAHSLPFIVTQPDGTRLSVRLMGDEDCHWYATVDGVLLSKQNDAYYLALVDEQGNLQPSKVLAHDAGLRQTEENVLINKQNKERFYRQAEKTRVRNKMKREPVLVDKTFFPCTGSPKALVVLVNFSDTTFAVSDPKKTFEQYLNGEGKPEDYGNQENRNYGSVRQYFKDMSNGMFTPQFDLYGPVNLPHPMKYYGATEDMLSLLNDACRLLDETVDFSQYDANGDGMVDLVYVIYAGYSASVGDNSSDAIWPKSGLVNGNTFDGVKIGRYGVNNELNGTPTSYKTAPFKRVNGIGLFCHEFSHCMGLPDFYPTSKDAQVDNQGMEFWSIMDGGEYLDNGHTPTAYTAWEREAMGWLTVETLTEDVPNLQLIPIDNGGKAYRVKNDADVSEKEYFMIENIQKLGWNSKQKGTGMIVYHVDYDPYAFSLWPNGNNTVNNRKGAPRMAIVPADGLSMAQGSASGAKEYYDQLAGDPFPGTANVTELNDESQIVNFSTYTDDPLNKAFMNITSSEGIITLKFINDFKGYVAGIDAPVKDTMIDGESSVYTLDGRYIGNHAASLPKGIYLQGNHKVVVR